MTTHRQPDARGLITDSRLVLAVALAAATLVVFVATIAAGGAMRAGLAPWPGIAVVAMAAAAFGMTWERGSFLVAALLAASGMVGLVYGLIATGFLVAATFPGPIFGVVLGLPLLGLGLALGIRARHRRNSMPI